MRIMSNSKNVYVNAKQLQFLQAKQKRRGFVGGRAAGKSVTIGHMSRMMLNYLPKGKIFLAGLTYNQLLTTTIPAIVDAMGAHGWTEYNAKTKLGHYVVNKTPPSHFYQPYSPPKNYENVISFINGFAIQLLSLDMPDRLRGGSYDGGMIDESALVKKDVVDKVLMPMIRGNKYRFNHHLHASFFHFTSAPWLATGQWVYDYEQLQVEQPDKYFHIEATAYDNIEVLGQEYIDNLKETLEPIVFDVEVLNKRLSKLPNGYYPAFNSEKHCIFKTYDYRYNDETGLYLMDDVFYLKDKPLDISFDFNGKIVSMIVGQLYSTYEYHILDEFFVKVADSNLIDVLIDKFCEAYANHAKRSVTIYGDAYGDVMMPNSGQTYYQQIVARLRAKGWTEVKTDVTKYNEQHRVRHLIINTILSESDTNKPRVRFNLTKCKYTIISIQNAPIKMDFAKDKRSEERLIEQERATHLSDCFDYLIVRKFGRLFGQQLHSKPRFLGRK